MRGIFIGALVSISMLWSCEKEELPKPIPDQQGSVYQVLGMGENYGNQVGFSLQHAETNTIDVMDWDMFIYPNKDIRINTSRFMKVLKVDSENDFATEHPDTDFNYDEYSSNTFDFKLVVREDVNYYILDLGRNVEGDVLYKLYLKIHLSSDNLVSLEYKKAEETNWTSKQIELTSSFGHFYSFINETQMVNPLFVQSDFYCGGYITRFEEAELDYLVRGILVNITKDISLAQVDDKTYDEITLDDVTSFDFRNQIDEIGYDWKAYNIDEGLYIVDDTKVYIVKYSNGLIYKLKFIDYYNDKGEKGYPTLSYTLLE